MIASLAERLALIYNRKDEYCLAFAFITSREPQRTLDKWLRDCNRRLYYSALKCEVTFLTLLEHNAYELYTSDDEPLYETFADEGHKLKHAVLPCALVQYAVNGVERNVFAPLELLY